MTMGVVALHHGGMAALRVPAELVHSPMLVALSLGLVFVASAGALYIMSRVNSVARYASVPLMALAVCGTHYTGMAAMTPRPISGEVDFFEGAITSWILSAGVGVAVIATISVGVILGIYGAFLRRTAEIRQASSFE